MRFAQNMQHDTSKVLRLPCQMAMEVSKVLRLPLKLELMCWQPCKSIVPITQNYFPHVCRHVKMSGSATPATQNDITTCFDTFEKEKFCSFPHRHATAEANQRIETIHAGASIQAFRARLSPIFTLCSFKIDVFLRVFLWTKFATSKPMFCARLPSIFSTSHKMPRLPRNLHLVATWRSPDNKIRRKNATWHV